MAEYGGAGANTGRTLRKDRHPEGRNCAVVGSKYRSGLSAPVDSGNQGKEITLGEQICDRHNEIEERTDHLFLEQLLDTLEAKEQQLIYLRYVEEKTQSEVAKIMGTTQVQISRREKKLLAKLRERA